MFINVVSVCEIKKKSQCIYKPSSVPRFFAWCLSFIYATSHLVAGAFYPPSWRLQPQLGQAILSRWYTRTCSLQPTQRVGCPYAWWSLTPPSHPYPFGRLFSSAVTCCCQQLLFQKWSALCCPDFPLALACQRQADALTRDKSTNK